MKTTSGSFDWVPYPALPSGTGVEVVFGTSIDTATGAIENPAAVFPAGSRQLCARIGYWCQAPTTSLGWQWYVNGSEAHVPGLDDTVWLTKSSGFEYRCIAHPPPATYELQAYIGSGEQVAASAQARVLEEGGGYLAATVPRGITPVAAQGTNPSLPKMNHAFVPGPIYLPATPLSTWIPVPTVPPTPTPD